MGFKHHFELMAQYNRRMNAQIYEQTHKLDQTDLEKDMGAFFGSAFGTLSHILVGDLLWLARIKSHSSAYHSLDVIENYPKPSALNDILWRDINDLHQARIAVDDTIIQWIAETTESDFDRPFSYKSTQGQEFHKNFAEVLSHIFNHQTHHRGQVSTLLNQLGCDIGVTDFIVDIPG
ncbi:DinB family protein [Vibrio sp.]|nr:DinB family protein [Vibrio sp.]